MILFRKLLMISLAILLPFAVIACDGGPTRYAGYAEAEFTYIASAVGGNLSVLAVERGQAVEAGAPIFKLDGTVQEAALDSAKSQLEQANAQLSNQRKGQRPAEIDVILAQLAEAKNSEHLAFLEYKRNRKLLREKAVTKATFDRYRTTYQNARDSVKAVEAQLKTARMGAREDEIKAAEKQVAALAAQLQQAEWNLDQVSRPAPRSGFVFDTYFRPGEWVPPGRPVVCLLIPEDIKVRFWVPEPEYAKWKVGQAVMISCDGCPSGLAGIVSFVSPREEYTPPVIFSEESRAKLVYMVEARPLSETPNGVRLQPGQPVTVSADVGE